MKRLFTLFAITALFLLSVNAQHQGDYVVQLLSVDGSVPMSTFQGISGVYSRGTYDGITTYYISNFADKAAADAAAANAQGSGFPTARVVATQEIRDLAAKCCMAPPLEDFKIRNVFFDFDQSYLRSEGKGELDKLLTIMRNNPNYNVELHAHTDAKGSLEYNVALSKRRRDSVKKYLTDRGLSSSRIQTFTYGEDTPIAKNEVNGADTPQGRQLNRRVELKVKDGAADAGKVEEIHVPANLQN